MEMLRKIKSYLPEMGDLRVEIPEFTRCCFCFPLRHGLLAWGYFKVVFMSFFAYEFFQDFRVDRLEFIVLVIAVILILDIILSIAFIVAGHLKNQKLYKVYYYYSIAFLCTYGCIILWFLGWALYYSHYLSMSLIFQIAFHVTSSILSLFFVQGYITLSVRTEMRKLANSSNFEFVNNAAEAVSSMDTMQSNNNATTLTEENLAQFP